jgi:hypothetical protein
VRATHLSSGCLLSAKQKLAVTVFVRIDGFFIDFQVRQGHQLARRLVLMFRLRFSGQLSTLPGHYTSKRELAAGEWTWWTDEDTVSLAAHTSQPATLGFDLIGVDH